VNKFVIELMNRRTKVAATFRLRYSQAKACGYQFLPPVTEGLSDDLFLVLILRNEVFIMLLK